MASARVLPGRYRRNLWVLLSVGLQVATLGLWSFPAAADPPAGYYNSVDATSAETLRRTLHEIIDDHKRFNYTSSSQSDTWDILELADQDASDPDRVLDIYRNASYPKAGQGNENYDREHSWPKSYGFADDRSSNYPFTDCHHLFIANGSYNRSRGNRPYRTCHERCSERITDANFGRGGVQGTPYPRSSNWTDSNGWETWVGRRGDVARALFYMDLRYEGGRHEVTDHLEPDLILTDDASLIRSSNENEATAHMGLLSDLLEWHRQDAVDDRERRRNDVVFSFQANRNPFIDHPEWAECLFEDDCEASDEPDGGREPEPVAGEEPEEVPDEETLQRLLERVQAIERELEEVKNQLEELTGEPP